MRLSAATVGMLLGLALSLSSCGEERTTAAGGAASTASTAAKASAGMTPAPRRPRRSCRHELGPFIVSMAALRDGLARGLSYDGYLAEVRSTREAYAGIRTARVPAGCLFTSGGPAERAFNLYLAAANEWGDCLATLSCNTRSIEPKLQRRWARASHQLTVAQQGLTAASGS